jgi:hypothetical protein
MATGFGMQAVPNQEFGGAANDGMLLLMDIPMYIPLASRFGDLCASELEGSQVKQNLHMYEESINTADMSSTAAATEAFQYLRPELYQFVTQRTSAWFALRSQHIFTASTAWTACMLCLVPPRTRHGFVVPTHRRGALPLRDIVDEP